MDFFDDLGGEFVARLREIHSATRTTSDGKATITFRTARIEAEYDPEVMRKVEAGRLIAIPNIMGVGTNDSFSIYEIADLYPMHYSMLTLDRSQPSMIRKEFMSLIDAEWQKGSKSTWIEIVAAPTGYVMKVEGGLTAFLRKNIAPLPGAKVSLLSKELIKKFICYAPRGSDEGDYTVGKLLGVADDEIPFTVNLEKLLHYHVGVFAFTGSGKSNLTSLVVRKAVRACPDMKVVVFDVSSEYGISILDLLCSAPSRVLFTEEISEIDTMEAAEEYYRRHVIPESLSERREELIVRIRDLFEGKKVLKLSLPSRETLKMNAYRSYGGLLEILSGLLEEKYGASAQKVIVPVVMAKIKGFLERNGIDEGSRIGAEAEPLLCEIDQLIGKAKLRDDAAIKTVFHNLKVVIGEGGEEAKDGYTIRDLTSEIMDTREGAPKVFVINLPEVEAARILCADLISEVFRSKKRSFSLDPRVVFVFDEAQEFIPYEKKKEDGTECSSLAVERLLRHGRKYHLHGWISTQRIAHLNTNVLQQLHSYFVSTMPRPYDRQLISDTFAIDDAFMERTLLFQNGDWLMTSFKATNTQNVPVFFHALNNEDYILAEK
ncbi:MAG: ATP-binding protein [Candidatus Methanosuratincola sp.]|jgi:DNA helicase HerA-like ATPase|nr:ATP-binding protein [Candidatus Methanosuratincola sp.]